jgi:hypothetical protein
MSSNLVSDGIAKFLRTSDPGVLCIRGKWGTDKTYTWDHGLKEAERTKNLGLRSYSYVSLFGVNSLDDLKATVFAHVVPLEGGVPKPNLETIDKFISKIGPWRRLVGLFHQYGTVRSQVGSIISAFSFMQIHHQIVCIDDLERRGKGLQIGDVLGLVSFLREQQSCKVVLILNDEQLEEMQQFQTYLEKVVDVSLTFQPTPSEAADIAIGGKDDLGKRIAERCVSLGIANIRVIRRIEGYVRAIQPMLQGFDPEVFNSAIGAIVLFCWSHDQPDEAPTLEFLTTRKAKSVFGLTRNGELSEKEVAWNTLLDSYGYRWTDDFDLALIEGIKNGYFDPGVIERLGSEMNRSVTATKGSGSFGEAWSLYHDSFDDNQEQVLDAMYASFMNNYMYITPKNLNDTASFSKSWGARRRQ